MPLIVSAKSLTVLAAAIILCSANASAGSLTPPGTPAGTMKPLSDVEARRAIHQSDIPMTISTSGSYYLAENVTVAANLNGISIAVDNVTLDLNGFTITGPGKAVGTGGSAIANSVGSITHTIVKNGGVAGFRTGGLGFGSTELVVEDIRSSGNGKSGIIVGPGSLVRNCTISDCGGGVSTDTATGINAGTGTVVRGNIIENLTPGSSAAAQYIVAGEGSIISDNLIRCATDAGTGSDLVGINGGGTISGNSISGLTHEAGAATGNSTGIQADIGSRIADNRIAGISGATCRGIATSLDESVSGNEVSSITGTTLAVGIDAAIRSSVFGNVVHTIVSGASGSAFAINATNGSAEIRGNDAGKCSGSTSNSTAIHVGGSSCVVLSNHCISAPSGTIVFAAGTTGGYYAANVVENVAISSPVGNVAGTVPAANVVY